MRAISTWRRVILAAILAVSFSHAHAVEVTARIKGTVADPSGAMVPKVTVTVTNKETGAVSTTVTSSNGDYVFQSLPIGTYSISATAAGFKGFTATGIVLNIDQEYVESIKLELGSSSDIIDIEADAVQVNTTDMQLGNVVNSTEIVELPLIGRAFTQLEQILPGVQASSDRFGSFSVNGSQTQQSSYLINGADSNDLPLNEISIQPSIDALGQFNLITGPLNAEYDRNSGAIVSTAIKSGTNHFHGNVFEFYRDTFLNTRNFFQTAVSPYHQNIFGGTVGGPILKDKLFIFGSYQGTRQRSPSTTAGAGNVKVPTSAQLAGNFAGTAFSDNVIPASLTNITGTNCVAGVNTFADCFGGSGQIPTSAFNPLAVSMLQKYVPAPNGANGAYSFNPIVVQTQDQALGRIDFSLNSKNQFTFVGIYQSTPTLDTLPFSGGTIPGFGDESLSHIYQYTFDYTRLIGNSAVNDFALHYTRFNFDSTVPQTVVAPSSLGFAITPQNTAGQSVPLVGISGYFKMGFSSNGPQPRIDQTYQLDDNFSKSVGNHDFKFGYDGRRYNVFNPFSGNNNGNYSFSTSGNPDTSGNALLDYLLGVPASYQQGSGSDIIAQAYLNYLYAQDTWKVTKSLTISYGIGWQIDTPLHNLQYGGEAVTCFIPGQQSIIFPTAPKNLNYPGDPGCNNASGVTTRYKDFGPRFGFAYAPDLGVLSGGNQKKLSIRGGIGIYYNRSEEETSLNNLNDPPFGLTSHGAGDYGATNPQFINPFLDLNVAGPQPANVNRFPAVFAKPGQAVSFANYEPFGLSQYGPGFRSPYAENFQLTLEREFPSQIVARLSYVGSLGRRNQTTVEGNPITQAGHDACLNDPTGSCITNAVIQNLLYPSHTQFGYADPVTGNNNFASIGLIETEGVSNYNALQASVNKGLTHGLFIQASYTYGHSLDTASNYENSGYGGSVRGYNQYQPSLNYGNSAFDARHRFVLAPIYRVPFRNGGSPLSPYNLLASGWEISGISTFATGFPYDISYGGNSSNSLWCSNNTSFYACPDVPEQVGSLQRQNPRVKVGGEVSEWFNGETSDVTPGAHFAQEPIGSFGNIGRNTYHGPGLLNTNVVIAKNFAISHESSRYIQIRMESDNVFNHTQFGLPDGNIGDGAPSQGGTFGQINGIQANTTARQTQLAAKIYF